jgi:hypothetical protein
MPRPKLSSNARAIPNIPSVHALSPLHSLGVATARAEGIDEQTPAVSYPRCARERFGKLMEELDSATNKRKVPAVPF